MSATAQQRPGIQNRTLVDTLIGIPPIPKLKQSIVSLVNQEPRVLAVMGRAYLAGIDEQTPYSIYTSAASHEARGTDEGYVHAIADYSKICTLNTMVNGESRPRESGLNLDPILKEDIQILAESAARRIMWIKLLEESHPVGKPIYPT